MRWGTHPLSLVGALFALYSTTDGIAAPTLVKRLGAPGPPSGYDETCNHLGFSPQCDGQVVPYVTTLQSSGQARARVIKFYGAKTSYQSQFWGTYLCNGATGSSCFNQTFVNMVVAAILDVSTKTTGNYANIQVINSTYWQGYVGEDDGQG